jgi:hypothetical protein
VLIEAATSVTKSATFSSCESMRPWLDQQPLVPQFLMSGGQARETNSAGPIPAAMLSSMLGHMMPEALDKLKAQAPKASHWTARGTGLR